MDIVKYDPDLPTLESDPVRLAYSMRLRIEVFSHYCGGTPRCQCLSCDVNFIGFLQLDHLTGTVCICGVAHKTGTEHRKAHDLGTGSAQLWLWAKKNGYPPMFQVLCANCNKTKFTRPKCPLHGQAHR